MDMADVLMWGGIIAAIPFVFFLVSAIKRAVTDGPRDIAYSLAAALCFFVIVAACILL